VILGDSARHELGQQRVQTTRRGRAGAAELLVALRQQAQHRRVIGALHRPQSRRVTCSNRNRVPVVRVVLIRTARRQHPHPRRERGRHINYLFSDRDELLP